MLAITKRSLINTIAERWRETYQRHGRWQPTADGRPSEEVYRALQALPATAGEDDIAAITGDHRFTRNICDECGRDRPTVVGLATEPHHATDTTYICLDCLEQAVDLAKSAQT
jgi:hypothetical protein